MTRRCSHCSHNGHNSRTCPTRGGGSGGATTNAAANGSGSSGGLGVKLFGVRLTDGSLMKKSASMGNLSHYHTHSSAAASPNNNNDVSPSPDPLHGYLSDDTNHASCSSNRRPDRKKGKPWTEEEHRRFLFGLQKLGKGDWRGIARNYVMTRTPTQVASHAQKYFIRQNHSTRRKRRSSLFDMVPAMVPEEQFSPCPAEPRETNNGISKPSLDLSLSTEAEPMEPTSTKVKENDEPQPQPQVGQSNMTPAIPAFFLHYPYSPFWAQPTSQPEEDDNGENSQQHQVLKPTPVLGKEPVKVDELVGMSHLNLSETENSHINPPQLPLNLFGAPSQQSAFHASAPVSSSDLNEGPNSAIQAV